MSAGAESPCLFQVTVRLRGQSGLNAPMSAFPFSVGRAADSNLRLETPGVWERHLEFERDPAEGIFVVAREGALVRCRGESVSRQRVKNGDEFEVGGAVLRVGLGPVRRKRLWLWEALVGLLLASVLAAQFAAGWWLVSGSVP